MQWSATDVGTLAGSDTQLNTVWTATWTAPDPSRNQVTVVTLTLTVSDALERAPGMTTKTATITVLADAEPTGRVTADTTTVYGGKEVTLTGRNQRRRPVGRDLPVDR